jgi:hypothetical protein
MPANRGVATLEGQISGFVLLAAEHEVHFWMSLRRSRGSVDMVTAEEAGKIQRVFDRQRRKVLVAES